MYLFNCIHVCIIIIMLKMLILVNRDHELTREWGIQNMGEARAR